MGGLNGIGTCGTGGTISAGSTYSCAYDTFVAGVAGDTYINEVTATVEDDETNSISNSDTASVDIIQLELANIYGQVRDDTDGDGDLGDGDNGLEGVSIELVHSSCTSGVDCPTTTTDIDGNFQFLDNFPGEYTIIETDPADYLSTADTDPPNDNQIRVTLVDGLHSTGNVFLDQANPATCSAPAPITGYVSSTVPILGSVVSISTSTLEITFNQAMATDGGGSVENPANFDGKIANITFGGDVPILSAEYNSQTKTTTLLLDTSDVDWLPGSTYAAQIKSNVENGCGTNQGVDVYFGFLTYGGISGQVRNDIDADGDLGDGDEGIAGVTIELDNGVCSLGVDCPTQVTDQNGEYIFVDLTGGPYVVYETNLPGYTSTADAVGPNNDQMNITLADDSDYFVGGDFLDTGSTCSAPDPVTGYVQSSNPTTGEIIPLSNSILQITFNQAMDTGNNGVLDLGSFDNKIRNITAGNDIDILTINWDGLSRTANLEIDTSNADWDPGSDYEITIKSSLQNACETNQGVDVIIPFSTMSSIDGHVENDLDGDGDFGDNDTGVYKTNLELDTGTCALGSDCPLVVTDEAGYFEFLDLAAGNYTVHQIDNPGFSSTADTDGGNFNQTTVVLGVSEIGTANFLDQANACLPADPTLVM